MDLPKDGRWNITKTFLPPGIWIIVVCSRQTGLIWDVVEKTSSQQPLHPRPYWKQHLLHLLIRQDPVFLPYREGDVCASLQVADLHSWLSLIRLPLLIALSRAVPSLSSPGHDSYTPAARPVDGLYTNTGYNNHLLHKLPSLEECLANCQNSVFKMRANHCNQLHHSSNRCLGEKTFSRDRVPCYNHRNGCYALK